MISLKAYKTGELTDKQWSEITDGFNVCFNTSKTKEYLKNYYAKTVLGFSFHAVAIVDDKIIGYNSILPMPYRFREDNIVYVGVSGGTFVLKQFRKEVFLFKDLMDKLFEICLDNNVKLKVGVPNENSFRYSIKVIKSKLIGFLPYYAFPVKISRIYKKRWSKLLDIIPLFFMVLLSFYRFLSKLVNPVGKNKIMELDVNEKFLEQRFDAGHYTKFKEGEFEIVYRLVDEEVAQVAYLMDFREGNKRSLRALAYALKIIKDEDIDLVLFIGKLPFRQLLMIKLPEKFEPKRLPLTLNIIDKAFEDNKDELLNLDNWNFGLMNFDAR
jgi:hypothetical protein